MHGDWLGDDETFDAEEVDVPSTQRRPIRLPGRTCPDCVLGTLYHCGTYSECDRCHSFRYPIWAMAYVEIGPKLESLLIKSWVDTKVTDGDIRWAEAQQHTWCPPDKKWPVPEIVTCMGKIPTLMQQENASAKKPPSFPWTTATKSVNQHTWYDSRDYIHDGFSPSMPIFADKEEVRKHHEEVRWEG